MQNTILCVTCLGSKPTRKCISINKKYFFCSLLLQIYVDTICNYSDDNIRLLVTLAVQFLNCAQHLLENQLFFLFYPQINRSEQVSAITRTYLNKNTVSRHNFPKSNRVCCKTFVLFQTISYR